MSAHSHVQIAGRLFDEATAKELRALAATAKCEPAMIVRAIQAIASPAALLAKVEGISESRAEAIVSAIKAADARKAKPTKAPSQARQADISKQAAAIIAKRTAARAAAAAPASHSIARHASQPTAASKSALVKDIVAKQASYRRK